MVKDIKYIIKRIIIGVGIAIALIYLKGGLIADVNALSLRSYDSNWNITGQCTNCTCLVPNGLVGNIKDLYIIYDDTPLSNGIKYKLETTFTITSIDRPLWGAMLFYNGGTNENISTTYWARNGEESGLPFPGSSGTPATKWNYGYIGTFTASKSGNGGLLELPMSNQVAYSQICVLTKSFAYMGDSSVDAINNQTNQIINNNNQNTNNIINNQNENTNTINNNLNDIEDTLTDDSVDNPNSDINTMKGKLASNGVITQLISLPITLYQSILNNIQATCHSFSLGALYGTNLSLPCINLQNLLGSTLWNIIDILCCGLFILSFRKKMVDIFNHMSSLKDGGNELE